MKKRTRKTRKEQLDDFIPPGVNCLLSTEQCARALSISITKLGELKRNNQWPQPDVRISDPRWTIELFNQAVEKLKKGELWGEP